MAVDGGVTTQQLQRAFGWESIHTAQSDVDEMKAHHEHGVWQILCRKQ